MELSYAFFARAAEQSPDGTLHVFGADFDTLRVDAFPSLTPFSLIAKFVCRQLERGETKRISLELTRPDGARSPVAEKRITLGEDVAEHDQDFGASLIVLVGTLFETAGNYSFHILVDDAETKVLRLRVLPASAQAQALAMRAKWMRRLGMSEEEIAEKCDPARYPADLQEEAENLLALGIDVQFMP